MSTSEAEAEKLISLSSLPIRDDPFIKSLLAKLPGQSAVTFSDGQLVALKAALGGRSWGTHAFDLRRTLSFWRWHFYLVFLVGRNRRTLSCREYEFQRMALATVLVAFGAVLTLFGILVLYLVTSGSGIGQIPDFSFGLWAWFKQEFQ